MALTSDFLQTSVVFLSAAVVAVPLAQRSGLGSVLGYLLAGVAIGPWGLGLISDVDAILHFAELGVVLLLFLIGLELNPKKIMANARSYFRLGWRSSGDHHLIDCLHHSMVWRELEYCAGDWNGACALLHRDCA